MLPDVSVLTYLNERGVTVEREGAHIVAYPKQAITPEMRSLIKAHKDDLVFALENPTTNILNLKTPSDAVRHYLMDIMFTWDERAAMRTCSTCPPEQAGLVAWHDLKLDEVFWGISSLH